MYLVDTNVVSELRKKARADRHVWQWAQQADPQELFISVVKLFELEVGLLQCERRDPQQARLLLAWLDTQVRPFFGDRLLGFGPAQALRCAAFHVPHPRCYRDAMLAARADTHKLTVVTRNTSDFEATGVKLLNPWTRAQ
jgi:predicted nucleic acid-binding protein